jgi:hypothetical protein
MKARPPAGIWIALRIPDSAGRADLGGRSSFLFGSKRLSTIARTALAKRLDVVSTRLQSTGCLHPLGRLTVLTSVGGSAVCHLGLAVHPDEANGPWPLGQSRRAQMFREHSAGSKANPFRSVTASIARVGSFRGICQHIEIWLPRWSIVAFPVARLPFAINNKNLNSWQRLQMQMQMQSITLLESSSGGRNSRLEEDRGPCAQSRRMIRRSAGTSSISWSHGMMGSVPASPAPTLWREGAAWRQEESAAGRERILSRVLSAGSANLVSGQCLRGLWAGVCYRIC